MVSPAGAQEASPPEELFLTVGPVSATIREVRHAQLVAGNNALRVDDLSPRVISETVQLRGLSNPGSLTFRDQSLRFELLDRQQLLRSLVGTDVRVIRHYDSVPVVVEGRLMFPPEVPGPNGTTPLPIFVQTPQGEIRVVPGGELGIDALPDGDWNQVRLDVTAQAATAGRYRFELTYQTVGLTFRPQYTLRLNESRQRADLLSTVVIDNQTGIEFRGITVLLADSAARTSPGRPAAHDRFYPVPGSVNLPAGRPLQVTLAHAVDVPVQGIVTLFPEGHPQGRADRDGAVPLFLRFDLENDQTIGMGKPLPAGPVQVVQVDDQSRPRRVSLTETKHTEPGQRLVIAGPRVPGIAAHPTTAPHEHGRHVTVSLFNEKAEPVTVEILVPRNVGQVVQSEMMTLARGPWTMLRTTVAAADTQTVSYTVRRDS